MLSILHRLFHKLSHRDERERETFSEYANLPPSVLSLVLSKLSDSDIHALLLTSPSVAGSVMLAAEAQSVEAQRDLLRLGWLALRRSPIFTPGFRTELHLNSPAFFPFVALEASESRLLWDLEALHKEVMRCGVHLCNAPYPLAVRPSHDSNLSALRCTGALGPLVKQLVVNGVRMPPPSDAVGFGRTAYGAGFRSLSRPDLGRWERLADLHIFERTVDGQEVRTEQWRMLSQGTVPFTLGRRSITLTADGATLTPQILRDLVTQIQTPRGSSLPPSSPALHLTLTSPSPLHISALLDSKVSLASLSLLDADPSLVPHLSSLAPLTSLTALEIARPSAPQIDQTPLKLDPVALHLTHLRQLSLGGTVLDLEAALSLAMMPRLENLHIASCDMQIPRSVVVSFPRLTALAIDASPDLLLVAPFLTHLRSLHINFAPLMPDWMVTGRFVTWYLLRAVASLEQLKSLSLTHVVVETLVCWHFRRRFVNLESLHVSAFAEEDLLFAQRHLVKRLSHMNRVGISILTMYLRKRTRLRVLSISNSELLLSSFGDFRVKQQYSDVTGLRALRLHRCWARHPNFIQRTLEKFLVDCRSIKSLDLIECFRDVPDTQGAPVSRYLVGSHESLRYHLEQHRPDMNVRIVN